MKEEHTHGGARKGAGRPATGIKRIFISVSCQPEEAEFIKQMAKKREKTISKYILDLVEKDSKNI